MLTDKAYKKERMPLNHRWVIVGCALFAFFFCLIAVFTLLFSNGLNYIKQKYEERFLYFPIYQYNRIDVGNDEEYTISKWQSGRWGYINDQGNITIDLRYDEVKSFSEGLAAVRVGDKWGYINVLEKFVISPKFDYAQSFNDGYAAIRSDDKWGYITKKGDYPIKPLYDCALEFSEGLAAISIKGRWGYIDKTGAIVISPQFDLAAPFSEGLAFVIFTNKLGYIDKKGEIVINPHYIYPEALQELENNRCPPNIDMRFSFNNHTAVAIIEDPWGYTNLSTLRENIDFLVPPYNNYQFSPMGVAKFRYGFIDNTGKMIIDPHFSNALQFSEEVAAVLDPQKNKWGYIDKNGRYFIEPLPDEAREFSEGYAAIRIDEHWGFIDKQAKFVIEPQFDEVSSFHNGLAFFRKGDMAGYISKDGKIIWQLEGYSASPVLPDMTLPAPTTQTEPGTATIEPMPIPTTEEPPPFVPTEELENTATNTPTFQPTASPSPSPSVTAGTVELGFELVDMTRDVQRGGMASVTIRTVPGGSCIIVYTTPAGISSNASGLTNKQGDEQGSCVWSWEISPNTQVGTGKVTIISNGETREENINIE